MGKRPGRTDEPIQAEELTVLVMKYRGGGDSLQRGFDAVREAIAALGGNPTARALTTRPLTRPPEALPDGEGSGNGEAIGMDRLDMDVALEETTAPAPKAKKTPGTPKYSFLSDFNLSPESVPSLTDFCVGKVVESEQDKYLVVSLWLQTHGGADPFTGNHIFTCFRALNWKPRLDVSQPVREMKSKKSWFDSPAYGKWRLTQPGVAAAEAMGSA